MKACKTESESRSHSLNTVTTNDNHLSCSNSKWGTESQVPMNAYKWFYCNLNKKIWSILKEIMLETSL